MIRLEPIDNVRRVAMRNDDEGRYVLHAEAQTEIDKRDQTIADLKALLYRAAEGLDCGVLDTYRMSCAEYGRLLSDIDEALA